MKPSPEQKKLQAYSEALSKLKPEDQLRKMKAVKSEDTIRRFLSEDAPDRLVHRFSTRINGTIAKDLSFFEQGRVAYESQNFSYARGQFMAALEQGDQRAHYYLGKLDHDTNNIGNAEDHYQNAWSKGYHREECLMALGEISLQKDNPDHAIGTLNDARYGEDKDVRDYCALRIAQILNAPINEEKELLKLAKLGNEHACNVLLNKYHDEKNDEGVILIGERLANMGYTVCYQILAKYFSANEKTENAIIYHILAIRAGYDSSYPLLVEQLAKSRRYNEAIDYCLEALQKGHREAYLPLLTLLRAEGRNREILQYMSHALYNGWDEVKTLLEIIGSNENSRSLFEGETRFAMMRGENLHPEIIERFFGIEMDQPPAGPFN